MLYIIVNLITSFRLNLRPGKRVIADGLIMTNVLSQEEYTSIVNVACKYSWVYPLKKGDNVSVIHHPCLQRFLCEDFKLFGVTLGHFHSGGVAELVSAGILSLSLSHSTHRLSRGTREAGMCKRAPGCRSLRQVLEEPQGDKAQG